MSEVHGQWRTAQSEWNGKTWRFEPRPPVLIDASWIRGWRQLDALRKR